MFTPMNSRIVLTYGSFDLFHSVFAMGEEWRGQFDHLEDITQVVYLPRSEMIGDRRPFNIVPDAELWAATGG